MSSWQRDEESRTRILRNICEYPLLEKSIDRDRAPDFIIRRKTAAASTGTGFYHAKKKGYTGNTASGARSQVRAPMNQIIKKQSLYTGEHDLGNGIYFVEMLISQ